MGLLDGDDAVLADLSMTSAMILPISGSAAEMVATAAICFHRDRAGLLLDLRDDRLDAVLDAVLEDHRVGAGGDDAQALVDDRLGEHDRGGGAVTGDIVRLGGDFLQELRAHVLEWIFELDLLGDRDAVVGDGGRAELLVEHDVAALRAERDLDRVGQRSTPRLRDRRASHRR